jgi:hypothetical protein
LFPVNSILFVFATKFMVPPIKFKIAPPTVASGLSSTTALLKLNFTPSEKVIIPALLSIAPPCRAD